MCVSPMNNVGVFSAGMSVQYEFEYSDEDSMEEDEDVEIQNQYHTAKGIAYSCPRGAGVSHHTGSVVSGNAFLRVHVRVCICVHVCVPLGSGCLLYWRMILLCAWKGEMPFIMRVAPPEGCILHLLVSLVRS